MKIPAYEARVPAVSQVVPGVKVETPQGYFDGMAIEHYKEPHIMDHSGWTHVAVKDGRWSDPTTWNSRTVPGDNARANVGDFDVVYDALSDALIKDIHIGGKGSLKWARTRTRLWVDTIYSHGYTDVGSAQDYIPDSGLIDANGRRIPQAEIVFWQSEAPLHSARLGMTTMGAVRLCGAPKRMRSFSSGTIPVGATNVTLDDAPDGWRIGDTILLVATENGGTSYVDPQYTGPTVYWGPDGKVEVGDWQSIGYHWSKDETRVITSIKDNTVSWSEPLVYAHKTYTDVLPHGQVITVKPCIAMLTHSIRFRSADADDLFPVGFTLDGQLIEGQPIGDLADRQKRAHIMFMHSDDVQARYAEAYNMARTDTVPDLASDQSATDNAYKIAVSDGGPVLLDPNNVKGRYAWHTHGAGAYLSQRQVVFDSLTAWASTNEVPQPGWAITHHNSRATIENCAVYNFRGAGIVSENGNEIGQWIDNVVAWGRGDGFYPRWGSRAERIENHNGHAGVAYENQARQILQRGNIASNSHYGWLYMQQAPRTEPGGSNGASQNPIKITKRIPDEHSLRFRDPVTRGLEQTTLTDYGVQYALGNGTYGIEQAQIPVFEDNVSYGCGEHFRVSHRSHLDREDTTPLICRRNHSINCPRSINIAEYSFYYSFYDFLHIGGETIPSGSYTLRMGTITWQFVLGNVKVVRSNRVVADGGIWMNFNGAFFDIATEDVNSFGQAAEVTNGWNDTPENHPLLNAMGDWEINGNTARVDDWTPFDSAADFPLDRVSVNRPKGYYGIEKEPADMVGQPRPYFWLDPSSDTVMSGSGSISIKGVIADGIGLRRYSSHQIFYSNKQVIDPGRYVRNGWNMSANDCAARNGCFFDQDAGVWKSRLWFIDQNRLTGTYFPFPVDVTLSGISPEVAARYTTDPDAYRPEPELPAEIPSFGPYVPSAEPPLTDVKSRITVSERNLLSQRLVARAIHGNWSLSGADAAHFEIAAVGGLPHLRWAGAATRIYATPQDGNGDNFYEVTVTFTDELGNSTSSDVTVEVSAYATSFTDNFVGASGETLEGRPGYTFIRGSAQTMRLNGSGSIDTYDVRNYGGGTTEFRLPQIGRIKDLAAEAIFPQAGGPNVRPIWNPATAERLDIHRFNDTSKIRIQIFRKGALSTWVFSNPHSQKVRVEIREGAFIVKYDGTEKMPESGGSQTFTPFINDGNFNSALIFFNQYSRNNTLSHLHIEHI